MITAFALAALGNFGPLAAPRIDRPAGIGRATDFTGSNAVGSTAGASEAFGRPLRTLPLPVSPFVLQEDDVEPPPSEVPT